MHYEIRKPSKEIATVDLGSPNLDEGRANKKWSFHRFANKQRIERKGKSLENGNERSFNKVDYGNRKLFNNPMEKLPAENLGSPNLDEGRDNKKREFNRFTLDEESKFDNLKQGVPESDINYEVAAADGRLSQYLHSEESENDNSKQRAPVSDINDEVAAGDGCSSQDLSFYAVTYKYLSCYNVI